MGRTNDESHDAGINCQRGSMGRALDLGSLAAAGNVVENGSVLFRWIGRTESPLSMTLFATRRLRDLVENSRGEGINCRCETMSRALDLGLLAAAGNVVENRLCSVSLDMQDRVATIDDLLYR